MHAAMTISVISSPPPNGSGSTRRAWIWLPSPLTNWCRMPRSATSQEYRRRPKSVVSKRVLPDFVSQHPELPIGAAYQMRNAVAHGYFAVDLDMVWATVVTDLPQLAALVRRRTDDLSAIDVRRLCAGGRRSYGGARTCDGRGEGADLTVIERRDVYGLGEPWIRFSALPARVIGSFPPRRDQRCSAHPGVGDGFAGRVTRRRTGSVGSASTTAGTSCCGSLAPPLLRAVYGRCSPEDASHGSRRGQDKL